MKLLTPPDYSKKMELGLASGVGEAILYLSPAREAFVDDYGEYLPEYRGMNACPGHSPECYGNCLIHSGQMIMPHARVARVRKTRLLVDNITEFGRLLVWDIAAHLRWCERNGVNPAFRFNGTSDWNWETLVIPQYGTTVHQYLQVNHPEVQISEYTKRYSVMKRWTEGAYPSNLHMTFSLHEKNQVQALSILEKGGNVAVVFRTKKGQPLPPSWAGYPVLDGDGDDLRWMDRGRAKSQGLDTRRGLVIGLRAKGKLARTVSSFAVDPIDPLIKAATLGRAA